MTFLQGVAQRVRAHSPELVSAGFALDSDIDLRADPGLGRTTRSAPSLTSSTCRGLRTRRTKRSSTDLEAVLAAYERYFRDGHGPATELPQLAAHFRRERPYPNASDKTNLAAREELAAALSRDNLDLIEQDPCQWDSLELHAVRRARLWGPRPAEPRAQGVKDGGTKPRASSH